MSKISPQPTIQELNKSNIHIKKRPGSSVVTSYKTKPNFLKFLTKV